MAIAKGNRTTSNLNPNGNIQTLAHTMNTGADGLLLVPTFLALHLMVLL